MAIETCYVKLNEYTYLFRGSQAKIAEGYDNAFHRANSLNGATNLLGIFSCIGFFSSVIASYASCIPWASAIIPSSTCTSCLCLSADRFHWKSQVEELSAVCKRIILEQRLRPITDAVPAHLAIIDLNKELDQRQCWVWLNRPEAHAIEESPIEIEGAPFLAH